MSSISGIIGCLCFGIGDWLLGYVDPTMVEGDIFYFIRAGYGVGYNTVKADAALALAVAGMGFLYPGFVHIVCGKTYLKRTGVFFIPAIPMAVLAVVSQLLCVQQP